MIIFVEIFANIKSSSEDLVFFSSLSLYIYIYIYIYKESLYIYLIQDDNLILNKLFLLLNLIPQYKMKIV